MRRGDVVEFVNQTRHRRRIVLPVAFDKNMYLHQVRRICDFVKRAHLAMHLGTPRRGGIGREHQFPGDAVDVFLGQALLPAAIAAACASNEDTKKSNDFADSKTSWKIAMGERTR